MLSLAGSSRSPVRAWECEAWRGGEGSAAPVQGHLTIRLAPVLQQSLTSTVSSRTVRSVYRYIPVLKHWMPSGIINAIPSSLKCRQPSITGLFGFDRVEIGIFIFLSGPIFRVWDDRWFSCGLLRLDEEFTTHRRRSKVSIYSSDCDVWTFIACIACPICERHLDKF